MLQERVQFPRRLLPQVRLGDHRHLGVEFFLAVRMHVVVAREPANVPIELRPNVIQLVHHGGQLFQERLILEARQIEREDIQQFDPARVAPLNLPRPTAPLRGQRPPLKPQGRQLRLQSVADPPTGLRERHRDSLHPHMRELGNPQRDVDTQIAHRPRKIKARHRLVAPALPKAAITPRSLPDATPTADPHSRGITPRARRSHTVQSPQVSRWPRLVFRRLPSPAQPVPTHAQQAPSTFTFSLFRLYPAPPSRPNIPAHPADSHTSIRSGRSRSRGYQPPVSCWYGTCLTVAGVGPGVSSTKTPVASWP